MPIRCDVGGKREYGSRWRIHLLVTELGGRDSICISNDSKGMEAASGCLVEKAFTWTSRCSDWRL